MTKYATFGGFFGAQALSQFLVAAAYPLLGRLYEPSVFGEYAFFSSLCILFLVVVFFRLEQALVQAEDREEALRIRKASLGLFFVTFSFSVLLVFALLQWGHLPVKDAQAFLVAFILYAFGGAGSLLLQYECLRAGDYSLVNRMRLVQALSMIVLALALAWAGYTATGLLLALALSQVFMLLSVGKKIRLVLVVPGFKVLREVWQKYRDFPYFNAGSALVEALGRHMPIWMLLAFAGKADAGFFANAWKFLSLPAALLMPTLGLWLYRTWMENEQEQGKRIAHFFRQIWLPSALLGLVLTLLVMYIAEPLLVVLLGPDWRGVGVFGIYLAPIGYMLALYVPIEPLFKIHRKQQWFLIFSSFQLLLRGAIFSIGLQVLSIESTLLAFVLAEALLFLFYLIKARQWVFPLRSQAN